MPLNRPLSYFISLLAYTRVAQSQTIQAQCGNADRSSIISDALFNSAEVSSKVLPALRDTICPFDHESYCALYPQCTFSTFITENGQEVQITINKTEDISPGNNGQLKPCNDVMNQIFSQCITGSQPKTSGTARHENIIYSISFSALPALEGQDNQFQSIFISPEGSEDIVAALPPEFQSLASDIEETKPTATEAPQPPPPAPTPQCETDCLELRNKVTAKADSNGNICTGSGDFTTTGHASDKNSDWFRIDNQNNCYLTVAKSAEVLGHSGEYCFSVNDLNNFISREAAQCSQDPFFKQISNDPLPGQNRFSGVGMACLADGNNADKCGEGIL
ncbi:uncharacterized protein EI97DRAFT_457658 [Westerdykella ornata]|uniref:Ecp2 effector protein domain-containing protein n=1 Tax=Westerdykella ornata TaxID=318751 RepID=A0A6A6JNH3_WESOR|nr:uncharacterized protein EI97DRAFT_457658 [Westerdykella ornata]KAF2277673.1 hypothetical protein EI97DRAFT_457658 [Westerdykella ornata]